MMICGINAPMAKFAVKQPQAVLEVREGRLIAFDFSTSIVPLLFIIADMKNTVPLLLKSEVDMKGKFFASHTLL
jgi:hypothetical protein